MNILQEAEKLVHGDRQDDYGHPAIDWARTAKLWSAILDTEIAPQRAILMMIAMKVSRLCDRYKHDSLADIAGYARVYEMIEETLCRK